MLIKMLTKQNVFCLNRISLLKVKTVPFQYIRALVDIDEHVYEGKY